MSSMDVFFFSGSICLSRVLFNSISCAESFNQRILFMCVACHSTVRYVVQWVRLLYKQVPHLLHFSNWFLEGYDLCDKMNHMTWIILLIPGKDMITRNCQRKIQDLDGGIVVSTGSVWSLHVLPLICKSFPQILRLPSHSPKKCRLWIRGLEVWMWVWIIVCV